MLNREIFSFGLLDPTSFAFPCNGLFVFRELLPAVSFPDLVAFFLVAFLPSLPSSSVDDDRFVLADLLDAILGDKFFVSNAYRFHALVGL